MKRVLITLAAAAALLVVVPGVANADIWTPVPATGGVSQADANTACAAVVGKDAPTAAQEAKFREAANTVDNTDDGPASEGVSPEWQHLINAQEAHRDHLANYGLRDVKTFTCDGAVAKFPQLKMAADVEAAVCAHARLDQIAKPALKDRVATALKTLGRKYEDAHADCTPPATTAPPTTAPPTTAPPTTTTTPPPPPVVEAPAWTGATSFGDGLYQVGRDISPGLYRTPGDGEGGCYYARLSSNDGSFNAIIANDFFTGQNSVTIASTDAFVSFSSGCVWTLDGHEPTDPKPSPAPPVVEEGEDSDSDGGSNTDPSVTVIPNDAPETGDGSTEMPISYRLALAVLLANLAGLGWLYLPRGAFRR